MDNREVDFVTRSILELIGQVKPEIKGLIRSVNIEHLSDDQIFSYYKKLKSMSVLIKAIEKIGNEIITNYSKDAKVRD